MYADLLYTPPHDKFRGSQHSKKDRSMTFSQANNKSYTHKSTEIGSHSPYRSTQASRLEDAKKTIDQVINDLEDQYGLNNSAIREVRSVNSDVLEEFRRNIYGEKENASTYIPDTHSNKAFSYQARVPSQQDDNGMLREMLNDQMRKNSALLLQMSRIEEENKKLKQSYGGHYEVRELQAENERLRRALSQASQLPQEVFAQLAQLKRENEGLRKDTVKLLHKVDRVI